MQSTETDSLGRATFHHIKSRPGVHPTARELSWLKHIERHGPQSSQYLYELTRRTHRCKDTSLRDLQKLRAGGILTLPRQQRATEHAEFNHYIYDLTQAGKDRLVDLGIDEPTLRPTGHWWHGYTMARVTSSIDIAATRQGVRYIPAHEILALRGADLALPVGRSKLIPDQLFALDYGGRFRAFALEVDRGSEPKTSPTKRKSWERAIAQYIQMIENQVGQKHYGLRSNLLVLWVFSSRAREARFLELLDDIGGSAGLAFLTMSLSATECGRSSRQVWTHFFEQPWNRTNGQAVSIANG